ncbi:PREDICTED: sterile alpha motif domain-containing protein 7 isoform X2 [Myotis brandtii]|nr:PREDICTED: sterile alpha motif domain-containing protein 7 isoform X2 [Myotis brandtii]XP_014389064.1 PREDICTED: sterile alpha motif domain-containing protein 7 isoform X2 [Myotis brandtii]XP_014389067.1 PREDICTED: sterile alpha motif domain-containing protein 7 isoform X2 [Myotis brandtii]
MINPTMAMNPLLTASGQQRIPLFPSPFEPLPVDRDVLPSTVAPTDPRQFCVPYQFGSSVQPNANMPNMMSNRVYSGWGILPPESLKAMARKNEMIQRQHTARMEMEMHAIYQQRRIDKINPKGFSGLRVPFPYGSSIPSGPATCHGRSMLPAGDLHLHRRSLRSLHGNPMLVATGPHYLEGWGQKCRRLRRGMGNQKVLDSDIESSKSQAEEKPVGQVHVIPYEEDEYAKDPETEALNNQKSSEVNEKPTAVLAITCGELEPTHREPWGAPDAPMEAKAWDGGREEVSEQVFAACGEKNGVYPPVPQPSLPGTHVLVTRGETLSLDADIQKWTVSDVHSFIRGLPGCSDYAQVFKDHAIDGETLPLLTEEHLRSTMGLKLGPALKIQLQVSQHMESMFYKKSFSLPTHTKQAFDQPADTSPLLDFNSWGDTSDRTCSQDIIIPKGIERDSMKN